MELKEIKHGVRVQDPKLKTEYTWVRGSVIVNEYPVDLQCSGCGQPSPFMLRDDNKLVRDQAVYFFCLDCSGVKDLTVV